MKRGSVKRSGKGWMYTVDLGADPSTGKRRQERKRGYRTQREAADALDERLSEIRTGIEVDRRLTVGQYLDTWIEAKRAAGLRASTLIGYQRHIDQHLRPHLGHYKLHELRGNHIEAMLREIAKPPKKPARGQKIAKGKRRNPKQMSAASVRSVNRTLSSCLSSAKRQRLIPFNPAADVELPRATRPRVQPWEPEQLGQFLAHAQGDRLGAMFETIAMTGLRRGEACGLRWTDVDFGRKVLIVRQQVVEVASAGVECPHCGGEHPQFQFGDPKTESGHHRVVDIDPTTLGTLMAHRLSQEAERATWGDAYDQDHDLVFAREDGSPLVPGEVTDRFHKLSDEAGLRRIRLHDLRHGQASLMLAAGIPLAVVSKRLGHSSVTVTSDVYSHLIGGVGAAAAEAAAALVPRPSRDQPAESCDHSVTTTPSEDDESDSPGSESPGHCGGAGGARTRDLRIMSPRL